MSWLGWSEFIGRIGWEVYFLSSMVVMWAPILNFAAPAAFRTIRMELRPFSLALVLACYAPDVLTRHSLPDYVCLGLGLFTWIMLRNLKDDDDRWKRRRQKLADKVAEVGGRLVLVPATSPP